MEVVYFEHSLRIKLVKLSSAIAEIHVEQYLNGPAHMIMSDSLGYWRLANYSKMSRSAPVRSPSQCQKPRSCRGGMFDRRYFGRWYSG
jgi:hypothetical protein